MAPDMVLCGNCLAFVHEVNPWQRDYKLIAFPIAFAISALLGLILRGPLSHTVPARILSDDISLVILGLGVYAIIQIAMKSAVTRKQSVAFQAIRRLIEPERPINPYLVQKARSELNNRKLGPYNTLLAYNRLQWIMDAASADAEEKELILHAMRDHNETDWDSLENSFAHVQYMVWLLPSLGFLGTVWGMTGALAEFSDAVNSGVGDLSFKNSLTETTQRLGVAFHTTLVGLAMVIPVLLAATACRRRAQHLLELLDRFFIRLSCKPLTVEPDEGHAQAPEETPTLEDLIGDTDVTNSLDDTESGPLPLNPDSHSEPTDATQA